MTDRSILSYGACGLLVASCALSPIDTDYNPASSAAGAGGAAAASGGASSKAGGASLGGVSSGGTPAAGATSQGGTSAMGGNAVAAAGTASGVGGATAAGGATSSGGASNPGGETSVAGSRQAGGQTSAGGKTNGVGGTTSVGGTSSSQGGGQPIGGTSVGTAGSAPTGGRATGGSGATGGVATGGQANTAGTSASAGATSVPALPKAIAAGLGHSCALISDGTVWCWGNNYHGELGNEAPYGTNPNVVTSSNVPVQVHNVTQAIAIATGTYHSCAVLKTGGVKCWGRNNLGQMGAGSVGTNSNLALDVALSPANATAVVAGDGHTCALLSDQTVKCWGDNSYYQLGNGTTGGTSAIPATVVTNATTKAALGQVTSLSLEKNHTCAVLANHSVYCWGQNSYGKLGDQTSDDSNFALKALSVQAQEVGAGGDHTCVISSATGSIGAVACWGYNWSGQLGNGTWDNSNTAVAPNVTASAIGLGAKHSCAVLADGTGKVKCWGKNDYGQIGDGTQSDRNTPTDVYALTLATQITGGDWHSCALLSTGAIHCWGDNTFGQLGDGKGAPDVLSAIPVRVTGL